MLFVAQPPTTPTNRYIAEPTNSQTDSTLNLNSTANQPEQPDASQSAPQPQPATFRRSYIVQQQQPPPSVPVPLTTTATPLQSVDTTTAASYKKAYEKSQSRVASLEKTIESIQQQHFASLKDLHQEIARLQNLCSDISFVEIVHSSRPPSSSSLFVDEDPSELSDIAEMKWKPTHTTKKLTPAAHPPPPQTLTHPTTTTNDTDTDPQLPPTTPVDESKPYYVLLHQQRHKYQTFLSRLHADNKRKQSEIESLRAELELVRDVLGVSGLEVDLAQLRGAVKGRERARELVGRVKKVVAGGATAVAAGGVLPPIQKGEDSMVEQTVGELHELAQQHETAGIVMDSFGGRMGGGGRRTLVASPPLAAAPPAPPAFANVGGGGGGIAARFERLRQKPKDYHNANLDYQSRAHLYSVPPPPSSATAVSAEHSDHPTLAPLPAKVETTVLPPISTPGALAKAAVMEQAGPFLMKDTLKNHSSSWTNRLKATQMLRNKNWSSLNK
ncbi:hypothetical protein HDU98_001981 [Podochytrium sp. JEL0797]|nr:hypothetical protein HDU98_001981 [Podochytrium sp. JEL0797]